MQICMEHDTIFTFTNFHQFSCTAWQAVARDFMAAADPDHPADYMLTTGGIKGLIYNG